MNDTPGSSQSPAAPALEVVNLTHTFRRHIAVSAINFSVAAGSIHGFVGPNGAGKTTTLKVAATLLKPQVGTIKVFGLDVRHDRRGVRQTIGFMPDHFSMYRQMTVFEYLDFFGAAYGIPLRQRNKVIDDVLNLTDMTGRRDDLIKGLSRGMSQRVNLCRVLVNDPKLLLLDEPASGLDPRARIELMEILQALRAMGKTIFISSHILSELATLCDSCTIIDRGQVKYTGSMEGLLQHGDDTVSYEVTLAADIEGAAEAFGSIEGVTHVTRSDGAPRYVLTFEHQETDTNTILQGILNTGARVVSFKQSQRHLNDAFMALTDPGVRS